LVSNGNKPEEVLLLYGGNWKGKILMKETKDVSVLVIGDVMLDRYIVGDVERISPEAPVPIVNVRKEYTTLGGAGNVVSNLISLGCNVGVLGIIGEDAAGAKVMMHLSEGDPDKVTNYIYSDYGITTTEKVRIISNHRDIQMLRYDREMKDASDRIPNEDLEWYIRHGSQRGIPNHRKELERYDLIIVSDYAKGMLNWRIMRDLKLLGKRIIVDPKPINAHLYNDVWCITPNEKEYKDIYNEEDVGAESYVGATITEPDSDYILKTMGKEGIEVYDNCRADNCRADERVRTHIGADVRDVYNVTGAGDTVVAVFALCTAIGMGVIDSARVANLSAGYVVTMSGTSILPYDRFIEYMKEVLEN
jgi:rfaE bifunctional protein kinase chain/domain